MSKANENGKSQLPGLILAVIEYCPMHGYGIAREIELRSADALSYGEGTLYPALKNLEQNGLIVGEWFTDGSGPAKKVYRISSEGKAELAKLREAWLEYSRSIDKVLGGVPTTQSA